jgi:hypothetical protein
MKNSFFSQRTERKYYLFLGEVMVYGIILFFGENSSLAFSIFAEILKYLLRPCSTYNCALVPMLSPVGKKKPLGASAP